MILGFRPGRVTYGGGRHRPRRRVSFRNTPHPATIRKILVFTSWVTGHLAEQFEPLRDRYQGAVQLVHNSYYADSGSMYSLYCARQHVDEDFLLLESDLIYERRALAALLEYPEDDILLLSGFTNSSDEVFVETNGGCLWRCPRTAIPWASGSPASWSVSPGSLRGYTA